MAEHKWVSLGSFHAAYRHYLTPFTGDGAHGTLYPGKSPSNHHLGSESESESDMFQCFFQASYANPAYKWETGVYIGITSIGVMGPLKWP